MYNCGGYFSAPADSDSISIDSLDIEHLDGYIDLDENGYPAVIDEDDQQEPSHAAPTPADNSNTEATKED